MANTLGQTVESLREELQGATRRNQYHLRNIKELRKQMQTLKHENAKLKAMIKGEHTYWNEAEAEAAALESGKIAAKGFSSELQKLADKFNS
tara:strand:+ start:323 stop:598 length:276 start_codon:yes stop_codon:yes gene_type:complete